MSQYNSLQIPYLVEKDEEYKILIHVAGEYLQQKKSETPQNKSGTATETVIRQHLLPKGLNLTLNPNVKIIGSEIRNDLLLLKPNVNPHSRSYPPQDVLTVIEIKNNSVGNQSASIRNNFDKLSNLSPNLRFAVVILSERKGYTHEITNEKLGNPKYRSFTLVARRIYPKVGGLYNKEAIIDLLRHKQMKKTGDWEKLISYLVSSAS